MPQKKTSRTTSSKTTRKTSAKRTTKRSTKKPKVYIPAYKVIIFCCIIITLCMGLLLFTTLKTSDSKVSQSMTERYQENKTESQNSEQNIAIETKKNDSKKKDAVKKESQKQDTPKKIETPQVKEEKKTNSAISEKSDKSESTKESSTQKTPQNQQSQQTQQTQKSQQSQQSQQTQQLLPPPQKQEFQSKYNFPPAKNGAQLIFVFDDGGQNLSHLAPFLKLPFPITVAVLPQITYSKETASQVRKSGNEVILHQPMQSVNASVNPGPGAIKPDMTDNQIISLLFQNITEIGPITGMNNHEGSGITADAEKMAVVLQFCSQEGIYFLDSRTNVETKVPYVARELGYSYYERSIFLDNEKTKENALKELKKGLDLANKNGSVIMIGHIWSADFLPAFLQEIYPELKAQGYTFSTVSKSKAKKN